MTFAAGNCTPEELRTSARILGLSGAVTEAAIRRAYHRAMQKWHPDLHHGKSTSNLAEWHARAINRARELLLKVPAGTVLAEERKPAPAVSRAHEVGFRDPAATVVSLASSVFCAVAYAEQDRELFLKFKSGTVYRYFDVPRGTFARFLRARSKSGFAKRHLMKQFRFERG